MVDWKPGASVEVLRERATLLARIREFFAARNVLEVETPLLARCTATDLHIHSLEVKLGQQDGTSFYLQTSPEFAMKRLLASGSGAIYQLGKVFRQEEPGRNHSPEFTLLEWYRPGYSMEDLMEEVEQLVGSVLPIGPVPRLSYRELFTEHLGIDPHRIELDELRKLIMNHIELSGSELSFDDYLQLLMLHVIEPRMPENCFVYNYPTGQAALARIEEDQSGQAVARRFELYCRGMELANGYFELIDAESQRQRFERDRRLRHEQGLPEYPVDESLLAAMEHGLPECSGVALGIDRLLMLITGVEHIDQVLSFSIDRA